MQRSEVYKTPRPHEEELPRRGDLAEIRRSHCKQESGLLVQVMNEPHLAVSACADCGIEIIEHVVEVHSDHPDWQATPGPWFYPIKWLKRIDPRDPLQYARIRSYAPVQPTEQQLVIANK